MKRTILYLFALFLVMPLAAASEAILGIDGEESTSVGIYIKDLRTDSVLLDFNSQLALTPASVMKCVTSASVLSLQGGERRFSTRVSLRGAAGSRGVWSGGPCRCRSHTRERELQEPPRVLRFHSGGTAPPRHQPHRRLSCSRAQPPAARACDAVGVRGHCMALRCRTVRL